MTKPLCFDEFVFSAPFFPKNPQQKIVNIYLLDRNVVSNIKATNSGSSLRPDQRRVIFMLKNLDKRKNVFSPLMSLIEGGTSRPESGEELCNLSRIETEALESFFVKARSDKGFWDIAYKSLSSSSEGLRELRFEKYTKFLSRSRPLVAQKVSANKRWSVAEEIIHNASEEGVSVRHPALLICLSVLFGSDVSRGILKPHKEDMLYNGLNDVLSISRFNQIAAAGYYEDASFRYNFVTGDKSLIEFLRLMGMSPPPPATLRADGAVSVEGTCSPDPKLFPNLNETEFSSLITRLSTSL